VAEGNASERGRVKGGTVGRSADGVLVNAREHKAAGSSWGGPEGVFT